MPTSNLPHSAATAAFCLPDIAQLVLPTLRTWGIELRARKRAWRARNKDKINLNRRLKRNSAVISTQAKEWRNKNRAHCSEWWRQYRLKNKRKIKLYRIEYERRRREIPEVRLMQNCRRKVRAALSGIGVRKA